VLNQVKAGGDFGALDPAVLSELQRFQRGRMGSEPKPGTGELWQRPKRFAAGQVVRSGKEQYGPIVKVVDKPDANTIPCSTS